MIRVGTIVNVMKAYQTYQDKLRVYKLNKENAKTEKEEKYWDETIQMTEEEISAFMNVIIPDPQKLDIKA